MADNTAKDGAADTEQAPITIKKYANRRLYNTASSSYVTLDHLATMVKAGQDFVVKDAKSGEDITRSVLTHIIVEEESKGQNLLPISFLRHLISFYGDSLQAVVPNYLEHTMQSFAHNQEQMRAYMQDALGGLNPFVQFEEMGKQNMAMIENAMRMFTPYGEGTAGTAANGAAAAPESGVETTGDTAGENQKIDELRAQLAAMQRQLEQLSDDGKS